MGENSNTMTFKTVYSAEYQMSHYKKPVYQILADARLEASLQTGQIVSRSYSSDVTVNTMGEDGSYSPQGVTDTAETLTVDQKKEVSIQIPKADLIQAHLPVKQKYARKLVNALINYVDGVVLYTAYSGAGTSMDDGTFSGTAGNGHDTTASNVATVFATAMQKLRLNDVVYDRFRPGKGMKMEVPAGMPIAIITPETLTAIELYMGGKDTLLGDQTSRNGYQGYFQGFELFMSNSLPSSQVLSMATIMTDTDTVVINGATCTADADGAATGAGHFSIQANADLCRAQLTSLINGDGTPGVDEYIAFSTADRNLLNGITATNDNSADTLTLSCVGWGSVPVSETLSDGTDAWTVGKEITYNLFALSKSISLVMQKNPSLETNSVSGKVATDYIAWILYGMKVFVDQSPQIVSYAQLATSHTGGNTTPK